MQRGARAWRSQAMRQALAQWLEAEEEQGGMTRPEVLRRHFQAACRGVAFFSRTREDRADSPKTEPCAVGHSYRFA